MFQSFQTSGTTTTLRNCGSTCEIWQSCGCVFISEKQIDFSICNMYCCGNYTLYNYFLIFHLAWFIAYNCVKFSINPLGLLSPICESCPGASAACTFHLLACHYSQVPFLLWVHLPCSSVINKAPKCNSVLESENWQMSQIVQKFLLYFLWTPYASSSHLNNCSLQSSSQLFLQEQISFFSHHMLLLTQRIIPRLIIHIFKADLASNSIWFFLKIYLQRMMIS